MGVCGTSWGSLGVFRKDLGGFGGLWGVWDAKLELDILLYGFHFPGGPSWRRLGIGFELLRNHFDVVFEGFGFVRIDFT